MFNAPCHGCLARDFRCHGSCKRYDEFLELVKKVRDAERKSEQATREYFDSIKNAKRRVGR